MNALARFFRRLWILLRRETHSSELEEEMAFHQEQSAKALVSEGLSPEEARYQAKRQFGNDTSLRDKSHQAAAFRIEDVLLDARFAIRQLRRNPGFAITAILILTLGIGATVALFAYVDAALLQPLPYENPSRLVSVYESVGMIPHSNLSYQDFGDWKKLQRVFSSFDIWTGAGYLLNTPAGIEPAMGARVSAGFFQTLGVAPILGRDFRADDDSPKSPRVVLLSHATWLQRFGGRSDVIGQSVKLDGDSYSIIGVLPRSFNFALRGTTEFWTTIHDLNNCEQRRSCHNFYGVGRLKNGTSIPTALADMQAIASELEKQYPDSNRGQGAAVTSLTDAIVGDVRPILLVLVSGAGLLLLIACVNVSSLLLVRSEGRRREIALRGALGASRARLARQFVTEGLILVAAGCALGTAFADGAMHLLLRLIPKDMLGYAPYLESLGLHPRVLAFAGAISLLAAALFSLTPVARLSFTDMREDLAAGGRTASGVVWRRFGAGFVVLELAIATVLLAAAGLLGKSFYRLLHVEVGFQTDHLAMLEVAAPPNVYGKDPQSVALGRQIIQHIETLPGVTSAAISTRLPLDSNGNTTWIRILGHPYNGQHNEVNQREVSSEYFATLKARLLRGRYFSDAEDASKPKVVVINQELARKYFPGEDPIGRRIGDTSLSPDSMKEVIGVVDDIREGALDEEIWPAIYEPFNQNPGTFFGVIARTAQSEQALLPSLTTAIHQIDPGIGTRNELTMAQRIDDSPTAYLHRSSAWLVGGFATLALLLGTIGLYGVVAYSVSQRTREIGVRMALGAQRGSVYGLILREAGRFSAAGIGAGLVAAMAVASLIHKVLFGISSWDAPTLGAVAAVLTIAAFLASYIPARRAASVNPVEALRME
jgi:predicted permease